MFQKEVANRIISKHNNKSYSRISVITQARCNVKKLIDAPSNIFYPKPKVDGTVLEFTPLNETPELNINNLFFRPDMMPMKERSETPLEILKGQIIKINAYLSEDNVWFDLAD